MENQEKEKGEPQTTDTVETSFVYEKIIQHIRYYAISPLNLYNATCLKEMDTANKISTENFIKVKNIFTQLRKAYMDEIDEEIGKFIDKYNLTQKFKFKSEVLLLNLLLKELNLSLADYEKMNALCEDNTHKVFLKKELSSFLKQANEKLSSSNEELRKQLEALRNENKLEININ